MQAPSQRGAITDASGRTLAGQTVEAFWNSIAHFPLRPAEALGVAGRHELAGPSGLEDRLA